MGSPYSGIVLNQNAAQESQTDSLPLSGSFPQYYQTFQLPADYARGETEALIPDLTGFHLFVNVTSAPRATLAWTVDRLDGSTWVNLASGTSTAAAHTGRVWFQASFLTPVPVDAAWLTATFRIALGGTDGLASVNFTVPNPSTTGATFSAADDTALTVGGRGISLMYRVLADVGDSGVDFLGNVYRAAVRRSAAPDVTTVGIVDDSSAWVSQPNPSPFAVESLYFDESHGGQPVVIDRLTLTPLTPGIYFHVYYSNDARGPGTDIASWEQLLWTPIYRTFQANRKDTYVLPSPINAKYVKLEFSRLQPKHYNPGPFQIPATYKKHPKWVLDYFLARFAAQEHDLLSSAIDVTYDALDLAYSYYRGDLTQEPTPPALSQTARSQQIAFLNQQNTADTIDGTTLAQIRLIFQPYLNAPGLLGRLSSIIGNYSSGASTSNYASEVITQSVAATSIVSNLQREALIIEKGFPIMFFFLPSRHGYRVAQALFEQNVAYYAGVREIVFHREFYGDGRDQAQYNETLSDGFNAVVNDWLQ